MLLLVIPESAGRAVLLIGQLFGVTISPGGCQ